MTCQFDWNGITLWITLYSSYELFVSLNQSIPFPFTDRNTLLQQGCRDDAGNNVLDIELFRGSTTAQGCADNCGIQGYNYAGVKMVSCYSSIHSFIQLFVNQYITAVFRATTMPASKWSVIILFINLFLSSLLSLLLIYVFIYCLCLCYLFINFFSHFGWLDKSMQVDPDWLILQIE